MQPDADATAELADLAAKGELTLRVAETVPLERFRDAYMRLERGGVPGRSCLALNAGVHALSSPRVRQLMLAQVAHQRQS